MANLPGSGYLSHADRTEGEMKTALEQLHDVIAELGSQGPYVSTISGGALTTPNASMILVRSEGYSSDAADVLDSIGTTNITGGRVVILKNNDATSTESVGQTITINHGSSAGDITLTEGSGTFILCGSRMLAVIYNGDHRIEVWRSYGRANSEDQLAERLSLGLGTSSVEPVATGSGASANSTVLKVGASANIATDSLLAIDASGNIKAGTVTGGNADTLDSLDSLSFVRTDAGSAQAIDANVTATTAGATRVVTNTTGASQTTGFTMQDGGVERALLYLDTADGDVYLKTSDAAGAPQAAIRIDAATGKLEYTSEMGTAAWESLVPGAGNGFNADQLDGNEWADIPLSVLPTVRTLVFLTSDFDNYGHSSHSPVRGNEEEITQFTDLDFPVAPNGTRRFLISACTWIYEAGADSNRYTQMRLYSSSNQASDTANRIKTVQTNNHTESNRYQNIAVFDMIHTPASGDKLTLTMEEENGDNLCDLKSDRGYGPLQHNLTTADGISTTHSHDNEYQYSGPVSTWPDQARTYVLIEYLDEG